MNSQTIPDQLSAIVDLQDNLYGGDYDSFVGWSATHPFFEQVEGMKLLAYEISILSCIRHMDSEKIASVCERILNYPKFTGVFKEELFNHLMSRSPHIAYRLLLSGKFSTMEIEKFLDSARNYPFLFYFAPELSKFETYAKKFSSNPTFSRIYSKIDFYRENNWSKLKEIREMSWDMDSLGYALKFDKVNLLEAMYEQNNVDENLEIEWSSFEMFLKPRTTKPLGVAASYGSVRCFEYLVEKSFKIDNHIGSCAFSGGQSLIIEKCLEKYQNDESLIASSIRYSVRFFWNKIFDSYYDKLPSEGKYSWAEKSDNEEFLNIRLCLFVFEGGYTINSNFGRVI